MHVGLPEAAGRKPRMRPGSCPYAGINRIRFNGFTLSGVSGVTTTPRNG